MKDHVNYKRFRFPLKSFAIYGIYAQPAAAIGDIARFNYILVGLTADCFNRVVNCFIIVTILIISISVTGHTKHLGRRSIIVG